MPLLTITRALVPALRRGRGAFFVRSAVLLAALLPVLGLAACAGPVPVNQPMAVSFLPAPGQFLTDGGDPLAPEAFRQRAAGADYILVGESHGNPCDHEAEARVITILAHAALGSGPQVVVGLEMAPATLNPVLAEFSAGGFPPEDLEKRLDWKTNWGHPFAKYLPVFRAVRDWKLPVYGLNVPPGVIRRLSAAALANATAADPVASLPPEDRALLPARIIPPAPEQLDFLHEVMGSHPGKAKGRKGESAVDPRREARFLLIQSVWDSAMAEQAVRARKATGRPVVVLAGSAHVEGGLGIARRIAAFDPGAKVLLVSPWRGGEFDKADAQVRVYCPESFESRMGMTLETRPFGEGFEVVVTNVRRGSIAEGAGLRPGDLVTRAGGYRMRSLTTLHLAGSDAFRERKNLVLVIRRGEDSYVVDLGPLGKQKGK
ncbi:MAG: ChaN family lipoprotein [Humidesulfovibrio sp.]|uniref:ChaN family lipoprotein n=1 Tax=Humidesulfovibrio sp. TaxID=2910988 RepID=UPI0027EC2F97|nr:ChaN family lipoprotein [Humidesulfovibrio sp.]MDQ7836143.1 ChaN family lipoprotein [Humidesulfovibrio sp.]